MLCSSQSGLRKWAKLPLTSWLLSAAASVACGPGIAQAQDAQLPTLPTLPIEWTAGPAKVQLGFVAELQIPEGYKFTGAKGARIELQQLRLATPQNLVGILEPSTGGTPVILEFAEVGFVKEADDAFLDQTGVLKTAQERMQQQNGELTKQGLPLIGALEWETTPNYDPARHTLEWGFKIATQPEATISHSIRLLGRRGFLDITSVRPAKSLQEEAPVKMIAQSISFIEGENYANYQPGDKQASAGLAELVVNQNTAAPEPTTTPSARRARFLWKMAGVLGVFVFALLGIGLLKKVVRRRPSQQWVPREEAPVRQAASRPSLASAGSKPKEAAMVTSKPPLAKPANHNHNSNGSRRRKIFDYNRYFSDLMSAVSSQGNQGDVLLSNGYSLENGRMLGMVERPDSAPAFSGKPAEATAEVLAHQRALIEEQKHLIQEQSKVIEEKSKLIAEKNQLLKMQAELMEGKLL